jgi:hypothetical protein
VRGGDSGTMPATQVHDAILEACLA